MPQASTAAQPDAPTPLPLPKVQAGSGELAALVQTKDWSQTPLGPMDQWPQSLRTTVSLCLASNFPINIIWGAAHTQIYNDGYRVLCGESHPRALGEAYPQTWASAWSALSEPFERARRGETSFLENQRMFLFRNGYLEETFFTFSLSPIYDESGGIGGLFHPVTELTQQSLAERRLNVLRTVAERTGTAQTEQATAVQLLATLGEFELDLPFAALYSLAPAAQQAHLEASTGLAAAPALAPPTPALEAAALGGWPLAAAAQQQAAQLVEDLGGQFGSFACGPYPEAPTQALVYPLYLGGAGQPAYFLVVGVSARRALDADYHVFFDLLAAAVTTVLAQVRTLEDERKRAQALAELDRAKTAFFSNISHEFRTPLTLMLGPMEDALTDAADPLPPAQRERLTLVQRNTLRLQRLVNSLLDFSRLEAGRLQATFRPLDLAAYTSELASVFRAALQKAGLTLEVDCPPLAEPVFVDPDLWEKVVFNLLSNALKFTFHGGVAVRLRQEDGQAVLHVRDTGGGIAAAALPSLFSRFYRVEGTRARTHEGSGIGLALVQELVRLHGGTIAVESELGQGTTFTVRLPLGSAHLPAAQVAASSPAALLPSHPAAFVEEALQWLAEVPAPASTPADQPAPPTDAATILVVDDNADMRGYVQRLLAQHPAWIILTAADGQQALEVVAQQRPDLVLSDVMMPRLDGFGLLRALKQQPDTAAIPVVLLSARAGEEATLEGLSQGADDYLVKPFAARELLARVRTQLAITRTRQDNTQLRAAQEELKQFKVMSDHAFDAFILMRADGSFAYLNNLALRRWGYTPEEAACLRVPDVDPLYQEAEFAALFARVQQAGTLEPFETLHRRKDGTTFPVEVSLGSLTLAGQPHLFAIARDIAAQVVARQQLEQREQEARALATELAASNLQLTRTNTDLDNFVYTASHDLKAPISNIEGLLYLLQEELPHTLIEGAHIAPTLTRMLEAVERFKRTIGHLTEVAKLQKEHTPTVAAVDLATVVEVVRQDLGPLVQQAGAQLHVTVAEVPPVQFSEKNLRSVVYNLLSNALKYRHPDRPPLVEVRAHRQDGYTVLAVHDNGLGMRADQLPRLFNMFQRFHAHVEGTGIGLYMVKRMVENAGGWVEVQSELGFGSTFTVYIPHAPSPSR